MIHHTWRASLVALLATVLVGCVEDEPSTNNGANAAVNNAAPNAAVNGANGAAGPWTVTDGPGGEETCGGPGPFFAGGPPDEADILEVNASLSGDTLTVEVTYAGDAQTASASAGVSYGMVATTADGTILDVLFSQGKWKVVDSLALIDGTWTSTTVLVWELSGIPGPLERLVINTFGGTDGESWCDRVIITF